MERHRKRVVARPLLSLAPLAAAATVAACGAHGPAPAIAEDDAGSQAPAARGAAAPSPPAAIAPRVMPNGKPACGNVASRAPRPPDCGER